MAFTLNVSGFAATRGEQVTLTSSELSITDSAAGDYYTLSTAPSYGTLFNGTTPLAVGDTFTEADVAAASISYVNNGQQATNDALGFTAYDASADTTSIESTGTVTVADNNGWVVILRPDAYPPILGGVYDTQYRAQAHANAWLNYNSGTTHIVSVTTGNNASLSNVISRGETWSVFETDYMQLVDEEQKALKNAEARMLAELDGQFSEFKTLIQNNGSGILRNGVLTDLQRDKLIELQNATQYTHKVHSERWLDLWKVTLDRVERALNA